MRMEKYCDTMYFRKKCPALVMVNFLMFFFMDLRVLLLC